MKLINMKKTNLIKSSLRNTLGTVVYVAIVALIIYNAEKIFGTMRAVTGPIAFLLLFVTSAAITGFLVLGQPVMLYFDNKKREAIQLFIYTMVWLFVVTIITLSLSSVKSMKPKGVTMKKEVITPDNVAKPAAPYSTAIKVNSAGNLIFVSGVVSSDINGEIIFEGDILRQTRQIVKNLIAILESAGTKPENVVKATTYVVSSSMEDFFKTGANIECLEPFGNPTDTLVGVASLVGSKQGQLIEVDVIAVTD